MNGIRLITESIFYIFVEFYRQYLFANNGSVTYDENVYLNIAQLDSSFICKFVSTKPLVQPLGHDDKAIF